MQTQITSLHLSFLYSVSARVFFCLVFHINLLQKAGFECLKLSCKKKNKHFVHFLFCLFKDCHPSAVQNAVPTPLAPRRWQLPAPGKGCDPHSSFPLMGRWWDYTFQAQFLSFVSAKNLPDEGRLTNNSHHQHPEYLSTYTWTVTISINFANADPHQSFPKFQAVTVNPCQVYFMLSDSEMVPCRNLRQK